jgi:peptidyl-prolyl cis-trans isomerase SurA
MPDSRFALAPTRRRPFLPSTALLSTALATMMAAAACGGGSSTPAPAKEVSADTWAVVDGRAITRQFVESAYKRAHDTAQTLSYEEEMAAKLNLLNDLIIQDILLAKAGALKVQVSETDLDTAFSNAQKNIPAETFQQELTKRGLTHADMRESLRRELLSQKVIEQEVGSKVAVADKEVDDFFAANRAQFNVAEESYHLAQIVVTPVRDQQVANQTGDDAATPQAAMEKVRMLMERLKAGASFRELAVGYSEDPESAPRGGDLGFVPVSQLKQAPPSLRNAVLGKTPGSVNIANNNGAYALILVVAQAPAGQRDLTTPGVREGITSQLRGRREQLLRAAYLTSLRTDAQVVNYLARRLVDSKGGTLPGMPLASPGAK